LERKKKLQEDQIQHAFFLSIDRLRKLIRYDGVLNKDQITEKQLQLFWMSVKSYHHQIFTASGNYFLNLDE
jgi:hypothetical protein